MPLVTLKVMPIKDALKEGEETVTITLVAECGAYLLGDEKKRDRDHRGCWQCVGPGRAEHDAIAAAAAAGGSHRHALRHHRIRWTRQLEASKERRVFEPEVPS